MRASRYIYFFSRATGSIRSNLLVNAVTVAVIAVSFLIFGAFLMLFSNINSALEKWQEDIQVEAYLETGLSGGQVDKTMNSIMGIPGVGEIAYISSDEALRLFRKSLGAMGALAQGLDKNPLPASFEIRLEGASRNLDELERIAGSVRGLKYVNDVVYGRDWVNRFSTFIGIFRIIGLILASFLLLATVSTVSNTIKLTVYSRKEELEVMKLLGASNSFIRLPFFIEGVIQGFFGSLMSLIALYAIFALFVSGLGASIASPLMTDALKLNFLSASTILYILAGGMALGLFGSFVSLVRFLKV